MRSAVVILLATACCPGLTAQAPAQGLAPADAARSMTLAPGLEARLVASEPLVRQPVAIEFDDRGRLWVIQYLQYPNPEGLRRVTVDRYSRTTYDRMPDPPPRGPRGADRITILIDTNHDGRADSSRDFVSGLNLATGLAFGYGGVFVLQVPYLLFYPDRNRDDLPDSDPEVLLSGFGMEDAHSVANSLTWGPDGWLYGLQGSTVTANIRGISFQQGVWRYHPVSKRFELFSEGGGNMWGLDFDRRGNLFACTNVGGSVVLHAVQGGYYWKSFGKHGALHNPYAFGYSEHVQHEGVRGGHVAVGGLFYLADSFPEAYRGRFLAADLLDHSAHWHELERAGSTFRARQVGDWLVANDTWFAPTDMTLGPDGAVYISDWHDRRTAHPDPDADWDRTNGRIFAVQAKGVEASKALDVGALASDELVKLLDHPNVGYVRKARRLLAERHAKEALRDRTQALRAGQGGTAALETLWALAGAGGFDEQLAQVLLDHRDEDVRAWTVRLLGDACRVSPPIGQQLIALAQNEPSLIVRAQLACSARRLPAETALPIVGALVKHPGDAHDPFVPLSLWWAVEHHAVAAREQVLAQFASAEAWRQPLARAAILARLLQRYAAEAADAGDTACVRLLASAPDRASQRLLLTALEEALRGGRSEPFSLDLKQAIDRAWQGEPTDALLTRLAARLGNAAAWQAVVASALDRKANESDRLAMIALLGQAGPASAQEALFRIATEPGRPAIRSAAVRALGRFCDEHVATQLLQQYPGEDTAWRASARDMMLARAASARVLLQAVVRGEIAANEFSLDQVGRVALLHDEALDTIVRKQWGTVKGPTPEEKLAEVRRLNNDLRAASGDPVRGRQLFLEKCATCHTLFGEGQTIGPELTHANRKDRDFLLVSLVDPSGVIRKEYQSFVISTRDGRVFTGLIAAQTAQSITLVDSKNERTTVARADIEAIQEASASLMPEGLYREFKPQDLRDLFRYLQADPPASASEPRP